MDDFPAFNAQFGIEAVGNEADGARIFGGEHPGVDVVATYPVNALLEALGGAAYISQEFSMACALVGKGSTQFIGVIPTEEGVLAVFKLLTGRVIIVFNPKMSEAEKEKLRVMIRAIVKHERRER
jgi:hypothetical protein